MESSKEKKFVQNAVLFKQCGCLCPRNVAYYAAEGGEVKHMEWLFEI